MKKIKSEYFVLSYENLKLLCDEYIRTHKGFNIIIDHSSNPTHNSFYLRFMYRGCKTSLRVSDHDTKLTSMGGAIRNLVVDNTRTYAVYSKICETGSALIYKTKRKRIDDLFKKIAKEN